MNYFSVELNHTCLSAWHRYSPVICLIHRVPTPQTSTPGPANGEQIWLCPSSQTRLQKSTSYVRPRVQPAFVHTLYSFEMIFLLSTMLFNFELLTELKYSNWFFAAESKIYIFVWGHNRYGITFMIIILMWIKKWKFDLN